METLTDGKRLLEKRTVEKNLAKIDTGTGTGTGTGTDTDIDIDIDIDIGTEKTGDSLCIKGNFLLREVSGQV